MEYRDKYSNTHYYHPDFMINNELVEIKGDQYVDKETGKWIFPYTKLHHNDNKLPKEEKDYYNNTNYNKGIGISPYDINKNNK